MSTRIHAHDTLRLSLFIAIVLSACSDGGGGASLLAFGIDDGASKGLVKTETVSADKGATIELDTGAKVQIPVGWVCDGIVNCVNGSDEPASCAQVDCSVITAL